MWFPVRLDTKQEDVPSGPQSCRQKIAMRNDNPLARQLAMDSAVEAALLQDKAGIDSPDRPSSLHTWRAGDPSPDIRRVRWNIGVDRIAGNIELDYEIPRG